METVNKKLDILSPDQLYDIFLSLKRIERHYRFLRILQQVLYYLTIFVLVGSFVVLFWFKWSDFFACLCSGVMIYIIYGILQPITRSYYNANIKEKCTYYAQLKKFSDNIESVKGSRENLKSFIDSCSEVTTYGKGFKEWAHLALLSR